MRILLLALALTLMLSPLCVPASAESGELTVYFANWNVYSQDYGQVSDLPWSMLSCVNHAFWQVEQKGAGFALTPTDAWADIDAGNPKAHFPQYAAYAKKYPKVKILLSIGGWTRSGLFSKMASTKENRQSFIASCLDTLDAYPWLSGLDIDWEYPGVARTGSGSDQGNPATARDGANFNLLLQELRQAMDEKYGPGVKRLTVCAAANTNTLKKQPWADICKSVDFINLMTYDITSSYAAKTGHHTPLYPSGGQSACVDTAVSYLLSLGVPAGKVCIGTPLYGYCWTVTEDRENPVGAPAKAGALKGLTWRELSALEGDASWQSGYDEEACAAYLYCADDASKDNRTFVTYESARSLAAKLAYIKQKTLGGIIVWECGGDSAKAGYPMIRQMYEALK